MSKPSYYVVGSAPQIDASWPSWILRELKKISNLLIELVDTTTTDYTAEPSNPRKGQIVFAASPWDPGSGTDKWYGWDGSAWVLIS